MDMTTGRSDTLRALLGLTVLSLVAAGTSALAAGQPVQPSSDPARTVPFALVEDRDVHDRLPWPEDRYALAGGCYTLEAVGAGFVTRSGSEVVVTNDAAAAEPFHVQATRLGEYLLATNEGRDTTHEGAWWDVRGYLASTQTLTLPLALGSDVEVAEEPSESAEWRVVAAGADPEAKVRGKGRHQDYVLSEAAGDRPLAVQDGRLTLVDDPAAATPLTLRHVADDDPSDGDANGTACATWPEIDTDAEARAPALPAVMSSHSWGNEVTYQRIYEQAGVVAPRTDDAASFVERWQTLRGYAAAQAPKGYDFGMGYGADTNGLGGQPGPRTDAKNPVDYSQGFAAPLGGVTLQQQSSGLRTFDINAEGVSQYGMFADWFHEVAVAADEQSPGLGEQIIRDMLNGSETYIGIWERAVYSANDCVADGSMPQVNDLHAAVGLNLEGFLAAIGQPVERTDSAYVYCASTEDGATVVVDVVFDEAGAAADVVPTAGGVTLVRPEGDTHEHGRLGLIGG